MELSRYEEILNMTEEQQEELTQEEFNDFEELRLEIDIQTSWNHVVKGFEMISTVQGEGFLIDVFKRMWEDEKMQKVIVELFKSALFQLPAIKNTSDLDKLKHYIYMNKTNGKD